MGINTHVYSIFGVRTEWNEEFSEAYNDLYEQNIERYGYDKEPESAQAGVLMDGMGCEYMVFGVELYDSGDARWGEMLNANEVEINQKILDNMRTEYMEKFRRLYPDHYDWLAAKPWKLVNLVHFS